MLVYGDASGAACVRDLLDAVGADWEKAAKLEGVARRDRLMSAFVVASGLVQGLADAEFEHTGADDLTPTQAAGMTLLTALARDLLQGTAAGVGAEGDLARLPLPGAVRTKTQEGFAFYCVYPEAYAMAARAQVWTGPPMVIGLRSIGVALAAVVAAASGAAGVMTLRPLGQPFARQVRVSSALAARLREHDGPFAVVDEGPGLSGSSFGCVGELLQSLGVTPDRIVFFPSHAGEPGPQANRLHLALWRRAPRAVRTLDDLLLETPISDWFADLTGPVTQIEDLSGGAWREVSRTAARLPPVHPQLERRKFRLISASGRWLARFAGLGGYGDAKFARAQALHAAGFTTAPLALRRGFLLERWEADGKPLAGDAPPPGFVDHLAAYLGFRANAFPAASHEGADLLELRQTAEVNLPELTDATTADVLLRQLDRAAPRDPAMRLHVDGRLHVWEWTQRADGGFRKFDALDHSCAHDLVGCQPVEWDIAGAAAEFGLGPAAVERLCAGVMARGARVDRAALPFFHVAYAAFQGGLWAMAEQAAPLSEVARTAGRRQFYQRRLVALRT
jgi:hypothetical protein